MRQRVLILTASAGAGHNMAARAILEECQVLGIEARVEDLMDLVHPAFRRWFQGGYEIMVRKYPGFWGHLYRVSDRKLWCYWYQSCLDYVFCGVLRPILDEYQPSWVICTHSLPQPRLVTLRKTRDFQVAIVVTDLHPHLMWLRGKMDRYFVPAESTKEALAVRMPHSIGCTMVTGIPVNPVFSSQTSCPEPRTALIAAGGIGGGPLAEATQAAVDAGYSCRVVTGGNDSLRAELARLFQGNPNVEVVGKLTPAAMAETMAKSALMISKSGGITTFECFALGCPLIVYKPLMIPGQEELNADWIAESGAGCLVDGPAELTSVLKHLASDPNLIEGMRVQARNLGRPEASRVILSNLGLV